MLFVFQSNKYDRKFCTLHLTCNDMVFMVDPKLNYCLYDSLVGFREGSLIGFNEGFFPSPIGQ